MSVTVSEITNRYLYGQATTPSSKINDSLIREPLGVGQYGDSIQLDGYEFMTTGAGRLRRAWRSFRSPKRSSAAMAPSAPN